MRPEIYNTFEVLEEIFFQYGIEPVITSAADGVHKIDSYHYRDLAIDVRSKELPNADAKVRVREELAKELGPNYDVILENLGKDNEHLHLEYDPKSRTANE